jgi:hypothetical protein
VNIMANETKTAGEKKITITDLSAAVAELDGAGTKSERTTLRDAIAAGLVKAEVDEASVENGKYTGDYVRLSLGDKATDSASILSAMQAIASGNLTAPTGDDGKADDKAPSVVKWFLYGADLAARSRTSQRIKTAAAGPEKTIERMAKDLAAKKNIDLETARAMVAALFE